MFGRSKPVTFDPYRSRRRRRVPAWLVMLLLGLAGGAAAVLYVQARLLPPRLSAAESAALRQAHDTAEAARQRLAVELADTQAALATLRSSQQSLKQRADADRARVDALQGDLDFAVDALPPDPRGGRVEVRAARFALEQGKLRYAVALSRDGGDGKAPLNGTVQFVVQGRPSEGGERSLALQPVPFTIGAADVLRGLLPLPAGFTPTQTTVRITGGRGGVPLGMRVLRVD